MQRARSVEREKAAKSLTCWRRGAAITAWCARNPWKTTSSLSMKRNAFPWRTSWKAKCWVGRKSLKSWMERSKNSKSSCLERRVTSIKTQNGYKWNSATLCRGANSLTSQRKDRRWRSLSHPCGSWNAGRKWTNFAGLRSWEGAPTTTRWAV